jgi:hypothetical protein
MVILDGHPGKSGPFTIRLKMPAGYRIPPHTHTVAERITVISGTVHLGIGEKFDERGGRELHAAASQSCRRACLISPGRVPKPSCRSTAKDRSTPIRRSCRRFVFRREEIAPLHERPCALLARSE